MIRFFAPLLFTVFAFQCAAKTYAVQSGEHADFSRIVILFQDVPEWSFGRIETGYELRTTEKSAEFDLDKVFDFIPRERIESILELPNGRLRLDVNCDCHADVFEIRNGLVIDVKSGLAGSQARFEGILPKITNTSPMELVTSPIPVQRPQNPTPPNAELVSHPDIPFQHISTPRTDFAWQNPLGTAATMPSIPDTEFAGPDAPVEETTQSGESRVDDIQEELILQLGRASAQGLISADLSKTEKALSEISTPGEHSHISNMQADDLHMEEVVANSISEIRSQHARVQTAIDLSDAEYDVAQPATAEGGECVSSDRLNIAGWGTPPTKENPLSISRAAILGEFDTVDAEGTEKLAKHYLYMTFGAEARILLATFDADIKDSELLVNIANIMDAEPLANPAITRDQLQCTTHAALWAALSVADLRPADQIATESVLASFAELPLHLRRHLGPMLAQRFLRINDTETASAIRESIARAPGDHGDGLTMIDAELALIEGNNASGARKLNTIVSNDGPLAPEAVIRLIDSTLDDDKPLQPEIAETAAAMAFASRGTPIGAELRRVQIRAITHSGHVLEALRETNNAAELGEITQEAKAELRHDIFENAIQNSTDADFLQLVMLGPTELGNSNTADLIRNSVAKRLIELGLPTQARSVLAESPDVPSPDARRVFASSYLAERRPELAIGYLAGLTDSDSRKIRASAHLQAGEYDRAALNFAELGDENEQARAVWRGEIWQEAATIGSELRRAAAQLALNEAPDEQQTTPGLKSSRALLERSEGTRQILSALLTTLDRP